MNTEELRHPTEDELVLLFYGDTNPEDERRLAAHVDTCESCQPLWQDIRSSLAAADAAGIPEPPADFERVMWAKIQREIGELPVAAPWWAPRTWLPIASLAVVILAVVLGLKFTPSSTDTGIETADASPSSQPERALLIAIDEHLERSELLLVELMNADPAQRTGSDAVRLGFELAAADDLVLSSRLYRQTAAHTGNMELASMLEDLERVLVEIARGPQELNREELDALQTHITEDDLLFKVRVVNDEIRKRQRAIATVSEGDL
jgi:hypothetical protein